MLAITLIGNIPINLRVFHCDEDSEDPDEWRRLRRRWDRLHNVRIPLDVAGFILITRAALHHNAAHPSGLRFHPSTRIWAASMTDRALRGSATRCRRNALLCAKSGLRRCRPGRS
jgi:Anthrone oxygenase